MSQVSYTAYADEVEVEVLMSVIVETRNLAIGIGIATNVANALVSPRAGITNVETLIQYSPVLPFEFVEAMNYVRSLNCPSSVNKALWQLVTKLRRAKVTTIEWALKSASPFGIPASRFVQTAESWRATCQTAIDALQGLKLIAQHYNIEICSSPAWSRISASLEEAANGSHAWITDAGDVQLPDWANRRQTERLPIKSFGILSRGDSAREVVVRDISESPVGLGLGLEGVSGVEPGDKVTIQMECGGILAGRVVWTKNEKAGLEIMKNHRVTVYETS
jgi:PilZ domain